MSLPSNFLLGFLSTREDLPTVFKATHDLVIKILNTVCESITLREIRIASPKITRETLPYNTLVVCPHLAPLSP